MQLLFRIQISYLNINNLKTGFWNNVHDSWCKHINEETTRAYVLSNHIIVQKRSENNSSNIKSFHGRFSVISTLRSPIKLKIFNCSHLHSIYSIVNQGSSIEVIIS